MSKKYNGAMENSSDVGDYPPPDNWTEVEGGQNIGIAASRNAEEKYRKDNELSKSNMASSKAGQKAFNEAQDEARREANRGLPGPVKPMKKGGKVKTFRHHDGIAQRGKTRA